MPAGDPLPPSPDPQESVEAEVRANILAQSIVPDGSASVADLALPDALVTRIADRIIRSTFEERHRNVFEDRASSSRVAEAAPLVMDRERWPSLRAYRAELTPGDTPWPRDLPRDDEPPELRRAADHVARRLAGDGLPRTLVEVHAILSPLWRLGPNPDRERETLRRVGLPTDLLELFHVGNETLLEHVRRVAAHGASREALAVDAARAEFRFLPTRPGFTAVDDAGSARPAIVRLQMTRPGHWDPPGGAAGGSGSGDNFGVLLHLLKAIPEARFLVSLAADHADAFSASLAAARADTSRLTVLPTELAVSQWAQDNLKPGRIGGSGGPAALLPRYASRAEDGAKIDEGDTAALRDLAAAGITTLHSPLHFQGGNIMLLVLPSEEKLLLVGEAEAARNVTLGLTPAQALDALRLEMGADRVIALPAVGFHLDTEVTVRTTADAAIAFVPDETAGARVILRAALRALETVRALSPRDARTLATFIDCRNDAGAVQAIGGLLARQADPAGNIPASIAAVFSTGPRDPGAPNTQRLLLALDLLAAQASVPWEGALAPHAQAAFRAIRRGAGDRRAFEDALSAAGLRVIHVPSISAGNRSASVINATHVHGLTLVPVRGGFLKTLDDAGVKALRAHLPAGVRVATIPAAESERRGGAVHCSAAIFPA